VKICQTALLQRLVFFSFNHIYINTYIFIIATLFTKSQK